MESRKRKNISNDNIVSKRKRKNDSEFTNFIELIKLRKCIISIVISMVQSVLMSLLIQTYIVFEARIKK